MRFTSRVLAVTNHEVTLERPLPLAVRPELEPGGCGLGGCALRAAGRQIACGMHAAGLSPGAWERRAPADAPDAWCL